MRPSTYGRARDLFARARRLPRDGRTVWLRRACGSRATLLDEVRSLLAEDASCCRSFLASAPVGARPLGPSIDAAQVPGYELIRPIGEGAAGAVYLARQLRPARRVVAVKLIRIHADDKRARARLDAEVRALAATDHPNVVTLLDAGAARDGRPFLAMRYVAGTCVTRFCAAHPAKALRQRVELFLQACAAVRHVHERGMVHGDVNPAHVLVSVHGGSPHVTLVGFGSAAFMSDPVEHEAPWAEPSAYTPPEAHASRLGGSDPRGDTYALGVLLRELLGAPPAAGGTAAAGRGPLARVAQKATHPDRTCRYQTVDQLASDVRSHLSRGPVLSLRRFWRRG